MTPASPPKPPPRGPTGEQQARRDWVRQRAMKETDEEGADGEAPAADQEAGPDQAALMKALLAAGAEKKGFAAPEELCQLFLSEGEAAPIPKSKLQNIFDNVKVVSTSVAVNNRKEIRAPKSGIIEYIHVYDVFDQMLIHKYNQT